MGTGGVTKAVEQEALSSNPITLAPKKGVDKKKEGEKRY
jgi:hypothetical protein